MIAPTINTERSIAAVAFSSLRGDRLRAQWDAVAGEKRWKEAHYIRTFRDRKEGAANTEGPLKALQNFLAENNNDGINCFCLGFQITKTHSWQKRHKILLINGIICDFFNYSLLDAYSMCHKDLLFVSHSFYGGLLAIEAVMLKVEAVCDLLPEQFRAQHAARTTAPCDKTASQKCFFFLKKGKKNV